MILARSFLTLAILAALGLAHALAEEDDVFAFIPDGGRTLLQRAAGDPAAAALAKGSGTSAEWLGRIENAAISGLAELDERQRRTLAQYLAHNAPIDMDAELPRDGRDLVLTYCQSCHIITVVVTQDRSKDAWLGTLNKPSHVEVKLTKAERDALADYLVINAAIPIDLVPEELRAGGASY